MNEFVIARNLDDAYRACDPDKPLQADDSRFVDLSTLRGTKIISHSIARKIVRCAAGDFHQHLLTGHRGCGKSTELFRLRAELQKKEFFVVYFDAEDQLDLGDLDYLDVLLCIAKEIESQLREANHTLNHRLLTDLAGWFSDYIIEKEQHQTADAALKTTASTGAGIPLLGALLATFTAQIKLGSSTRKTTRQNLKRELPQFINFLNKLILDARDKIIGAGHQDLVLLVDGLEKTPYDIRSDGKSTHEHLFVIHAEQLKAPECHIIYTMPISLAYNANLGDVFDHQVIPMVKTSQQEGVDKLCEVIAKRLDVDAVFEDPAHLRDLVLLSGGVMRDLMRLIRFATDTDAEKISAIEINDARNTLIREYDRLVRYNELDAMDWIRQHRRVHGDSSHTRMLYLRIILEYQNGERWASLHPAVEAIPWLKKELAALELTRNKC